MADDKRVLDTKRLPSKLPILTSTVVWLVLDHLNASPVVRGIVWTLVALLWVGAIVAVANQESFDPWEKSNAPR